MSSIEYLLVQFPLVCESKGKAQIFKAANGVMKTD